MTLKEKAKAMRDAIDGIELALMGCDFPNFQRIFEGARDEMVIAPKMTVGQMRQVCAALTRCTHIINSDKYTL